MIATRLHKMIEQGVKEPLLDDMMAAPKFSIGDDLVAIMPRPDVQKSIAAMIQAGIARLPYAPLLLEFRVAPSDIWHFVLLDEIGNTGAGGISARCAHMASDYTVVSPSVIRVGIAPEAIVIDQWNTELEAASAGIAVSMALLMMNLRGVEKTVIECEPLNRQRRKKGKPSIPRHTLVRIGTIYDRQGRGHQIGGTLGKHMPVHLRAGHVRNQACGEGMQDHRLVYIPPVLVNYRGGEEKPRLPERLVRV